MRQPLAEAADLARILDQRKAGAHRRHAADRNVSRRGHGKPGGGKTEHKAVGVLTRRQMLAFAHHVPDVAEHEEIAGHGARQARDVVGGARHKTRGKTLCEMPGRIIFRDGVADARRQGIADGDVLFTREFQKAAREIGIACGQRGLDVLFDQSLVIPQSRIDLNVGQLLGLIICAARMA